MLAGAGVTLYTPGSGSTLLLREGSTAPGTTGAVFSGSLSLGSSGVAANGRFEFLTSLSGGDANAANDQAIYIADTTGAAPTLLARKGSPAPGTDAVFLGIQPVLLPP
jgi:hypothetical protein